MSEGHITAGTEKGKVIAEYCRTSRACQKPLEALYDNCMGAFDVAEKQPTSDALRQCFRRITSSSFQQRHILLRSFTRPQFDVAKQAVHRLPAASQPARTPGSAERTEADTFREGYLHDRCGPEKKRSCASTLNKVYEVCRSLITNAGKASAHPKSRSLDDPDELAGIAVMEESAIAAKTQQCIRNFAGERYDARARLSRMGSLRRADHANTRAALQTHPRSPQR